MRLTRHPANTGISLFSTFAMPIALSAIGWKLYLINGAWDALQAIFVAICWIETKGLTLEDIDRLMDGKKPLQGHGSEEGSGIIEGCDLKEGALETVSKVKTDE